MKPYRPSNGSEGEMFQEAWCWRCKRDRAAREGRPEDGCDILSRTMVYMADDPRYPTEWIYDPEKMLREGALTIGGDDGGARCTAFELEGKLKRVICDTHHAGGGAYYKDECPSCLAASPGAGPARGEGMKAWLVPYERTCRGSACVEAPTAEEAETLVRSGDFEPDRGEEQVDWSTAGPAKEEQ